MIRLILTSIILTILAQPVWAETGSPECVPIMDTVTGLPDSPAEYADWVDRGCVSGEKVFIDNLCPEDLRYVINLVCDLRHTVYVDGYDKRSDERNFAVICIKE